MNKIHEEQNRNVDPNSKNITLSNDPDAPSSRASADLDKATLGLDGTDGTSSSRKPTHLNLSIQTMDAAKRKSLLKDHDQVVNPHASEDGAFSDSERDDESRHLLLPVEQEDDDLMSGEEGNDDENTPIDVAAGEHGFRWRYLKTLQLVA